MITKIHGLGPPKNVKVLPPTYWGGPTIHNIGYMHNSDTTTTYCGRDNPVVRMGFSSPVHTPKRILLHKNVTLRKLLYGCISRI